MADSIKISATTATVESTAVEVTKNIDTSYTSLTCAHLQGTEFFTDYRFDYDTMPKKMTVYFSVNTGVDERRETIAVKNGGKKVGELELIQRGQGGGGSFSWGQSITRNVEAIAGQVSNSYRNTFESEVKFIAVSDGGWIELTASTAGQGYVDNFSVNVLANDTVVARTGHVYAYTGSNETVGIWEIQQKAGSGPTPQDYFYWDNSGEETAVTTNNISAEGSTGVPRTYRTTYPNINFKSSKDWLIIKSIDGNKITVSVGRNTGADRDGYIYAYTGNTYSTACVVGEWKIEQHSGSGYFFQWNSTGTYTAETLNYSSEGTGSNVLSNGFTTNYSPLTIEVTGTTGNWLSVVSVGVGSPVEVSISENDSTDQRTGYISVKNNSSEVGKWTIQQNAGSGPQPADFYWVSTNTNVCTAQTVPVEGSTNIRESFVTNYTSLEFSSDKTWITVLSHDANNLYYRVDGNQVGDPTRSGVITVKTGSTIVGSLTVPQDGEGGGKYFYFYNEMQPSIRLTAHTTNLPFYDSTGTTLWIRTNYVSDELKYEVKSGDTIAKLNSFVIEGYGTQISFQVNPRTPRETDQKYSVISIIDNSTNLEVGELTIYQPYYKNYYFYWKDASTPTPGESGKTAVQYTGTSITIPFATDLANNVTGAGGEILVFSGCVLTIDGSAVETASTVTLQVNGDNSHVTINFQPNNESSSVCYDIKCVAYIRHPDNCKADVYINDCAEDAWHWGGYTNFYSVIYRVVQHPDYTIKWDVADDYYGHGHGTSAYTRNVDGVAGMVINPQYNHSVKNIHYGSGNGISEYYITKSEPIVSSFGCNIGPLVYFGVNTTRDEKDGRGVFYFRDAYGEGDDGLVEAATYTVHQSGNTHINPSQERPFFYWADIFDEQGYYCKSAKTISVYSDTQVAALNYISDIQHAVPSDAGTGLTFVYNDPDGIIRNLARNNSIMQIAPYFNENTTENDRSIVISAVCGDTLVGCVEIIQLKPYKRPVNFHFPEKYVMGLDSQIQADMNGADVSLKIRYYNAGQHSDSSITYTGTVTSATESSVDLTTTDTRLFELTSPVSGAIEFSFYLDINENGTDVSFTDSESSFLTFHGNHLKGNIENGVEKGFMFTYDVPGAEVGHEDDPVYITFNTGEGTMSTPFPTN